MAAASRHCPGADSLQTQDRRTLPASKQCIRACVEPCETTSTQHCRAGWQRMEMGSSRRLVAPKTLIGCAALCCADSCAHSGACSRSCEAVAVQSEACEGIGDGEICAGKDERTANLVCIATLQSLARWNGQIWCSMGALSWTGDCG